MPFSESKHNRITKGNRVQFFICMTACKKKWKLGLIRSHHSGQQGPPYHGRNSFTAELVVFLPLKYLNFHINVR